MATDSHRKCPDCRHDAPALFVSNQGDGRCGECDGQGRYFGVNDAVVSVFTFGNVESETTCSACHGTGQCQTCGGLGYEYYNSTGIIDEEDDKNHEEQEDEYITSDRLSSYNESYSEIGIEVYTPSVSSSENKKNFGSITDIIFSVVFGIIVLAVVVAVILFLIQIIGIILIILLIIFLAAALA